MKRGKNVKIEAFDEMKRSILIWLLLLWACTNCVEYYFLVIFGLLFCSFSFFRDFHLVQPVFSTYFWLFSPISTSSRGLFLVSLSLSLFVSFLFLFAVSLSIFLIFFLSTFPSLLILICLAPLSPFCSLAIFLISLDIHHKIDLRVVIENNR